jgi:hypothetical protein
MMNKDVLAKFDTYPYCAKAKLLALRVLILEVIDKHNLGDVEETLKWGEPSYQVNGGSAVRIDYKAKAKNSYFLFFNCKTKLVDTFRELYSDVLTFAGNRAIVLDVNAPLPIDILRHCIELSLKYKSIKHLPLLGA